MSARRERRRVLGRTIREHLVDGRPVAEFLVAEHPLPTSSTLD